MDISLFQGTSQEKEALSRFLWENSDDGIFIVDPISGKLLCCNSTFLQFIGRSTPEDIDSIWDMVPPEAQKRLQERITSASDRRFEVSPPDIFTCLSSATGPFDAEIMVSCTTYQEQPAVQGLLRKMTDPRRLRQRYRQAQKMEAVGTLSGGIAHEFNNLMQAISGYTELLMYNPGLADPVRKKLEAIQETTRRAADLTREFMLFNQPVETRFRTLNLNLEVTLVQKLLGKTFPPTIQVQLHLDPELKSIHGDSAYLGQVLLNLAINAMEAMEEGGELVIQTRNITVGPNGLDECPKMDSGEYVVLTHSDTGHGMEPAVLDRMFDPAFTTRRASGHRGLGLSMVRDILRDHRGYVLCNSEPDSGTAFTLFFPVRLDSPIDEALPSEDSRPGWGRETILFADDEAMIRDAGRELLSYHGYTVLTAEDGESALATYRRRKSEIDLILLNLIMQGGGGECLNALREIDPGVKVIVTSGYSPDPPTRKRIDQAARAFLAKPYDMNQLLEQVRTVLDQNEP